MSKTPAPAQFDFAHFSNLDPQGKKKWYTLPIPWDPTPRLEVCIAGPGNKPYGVAIAKVNTTRNRRRGVDGLTLLKESTQIDRELFPKYVVTGWEGVRDSEGKEVPFSGQACKDFFDSLPDWIVNRVSAFCAEPTNFIDDDSPYPGDIDDQAGE